jgi:hypothetical protein
MPPKISRASFVACIFIPVKQGFKAKRENTIILAASGNGCFLINFQKSKNPPSKKVAF